MKKKLNPVAKKWVATLRSGKIKQTNGQLGRETGSRCCLGVLCDLAVKAGVITDFELLHGSLPTKVRQWAGLRTLDGHYTNKCGSLTCLANDNDKSKKSFRQIADIIESQSEGLFV